MKGFIYSKLIFIKFIEIIKYVKDSIGFINSDQSLVEKYILLHQVTILLLHGPVGNPL